MKAFLEDLEAFLVKHPHILISSTYSNAKIKFVDTSGACKPVISKHRSVEWPSVSRMIKDFNELGDK